jgi:predicted O-linked N-acetylglucosamine transferase (SPINDLY family)
VNHQIAETNEDYIDAATKLSGDRDQLAQLRSSLRAKMGASPLMDATAFARDMESIYRQIWSQWCERPA